MTGLINLSFFALVASISTVAAQESPRPVPSPISETSPSLSITPAESIAAPLPPGQTASPTPTRSIRISFVPPPMEGKISLGIYDAKGELLRVLHHESDVNEFQIGADALATQWDGRNDDGQELPAGEYHARGYLVGSLKVERVSEAATLPAGKNLNGSVKVKLTPNPLANDKRAMVELAAGYDNDGSYLETSDGLPLLTVSKSPMVSRVLITKKGDGSINIWQTDGTGSHEFRISNVDQIMGFDCGEIELR